MKITINSTGEELNFQNGREAVEVLSERGIITAPKSDKFNPNMILYGPVRAGTISIDTGTHQQPALNFDTPAPAPAKAGQQQREQADPLASFANLISSYLPQQQPQTAPVDIETVKELIREELSATRPQVHEFKVQDRPTATHTGRLHPEFNNLLTVCAAGLSAWLTGPAGSGKTTAAGMVAKCLNLPFYSVSVCSQTTEFKLLGYQDANGKYVESLFFRAYSQGGVFLLDEVDNGNPNVLAVLNAALANGHCAFPCGMIERHKDFVCIAAANTIGTGANLQYVGRNPIDATTIDRFQFIYWGYDEELEKEISGNAEFTRKVQALRHKAEKKGLRCIISPRASIAGARLLAIGMDENTVLNAVIFNKMTESDRKTLTA